MNNVAEEVPRALDPKNNAPGGKDEEKDGPLEEGIVHNIVDNVAEEVPLALDPGLLHAGTAPKHHHNTSYNIKLGKLQHCLTIVLIKGFKTILIISAKNKRHNNTMISELHTVTIYILI
jgi:hypothetical protein